MELRSQEVVDEWFGQEESKTEERPREEPVRDAVDERKGQRKSKERVDVLAETNENQSLHIIVLRRCLAMGLRVSKGRQVQRARKTNLVRPPRDDVVLLESCPQREYDTEEDISAEKEDEAFVQVPGVQPRWLEYG